MPPFRIPQELIHLAARSSEVLDQPRSLEKSSFTLDSSGVAGFFGGDGAVSGMATVNLIPNRRWGGWYNSPGSYEIAKQYGQLANSRFWDGLFPGGKHDPARLFELDGKRQLTYCRNLSLLSKCFLDQCVPVFIPDCTRHI